MKAYVIKRVPEKEYPHGFGCRLGVLEGAEEDEGEPGRPASRL